MIGVSAKSIFGDVQALYIKFAPVEKTIAVIEAGFTGAKRFNFCARQHHTCYKGILEKIFIICFPVTEFQLFFFVKI